MNMRSRILLAAVIIASNCIAQNNLFTIKDAVSKGRTALAPKRLTNIAFIPNSNNFAYVDNNVLNICDNASAKLKQQIKLNEVNTGLKLVNDDTLGAFPQIEWIGKDIFKFFNSKGQEVFYSTLESANIYKKEKMARPEGGDESPAGREFAYSRDNNVYISKGASETQITTDGSYSLSYGTSVHRDEFGISKGTFWSPKGGYLAFYRMDQSDVTDYPIIDWSTYPAQNKNIKYPMAGNKSHYVTIGIYALNQRSTTYLKTEGPKDQYLTNIAWSPDEKFIYVVILNREQNHFKVNEYDVKTGDFVRTLFEEKDEKYVEPLNPMLFVKNNPSQFIWQSRRDGFNHFYLYDIKGNLIKQLTKGNWEVKDENGFDEKGENLFFHANEQSPVNQDLYMVNLKSGFSKRITQGNGFHSAVINPKGDFVIDNFSSCYTPREYSAVSIKSGKSNTFYKAENPIKDYKLGKWNMFTIKNNEGTDLHCRMFKPVDFDSTKKYPVIVYLYNGPHNQLVLNSWMAGGELWYQYMAQKGFIIFTLDGRGTSYRGKAWEQAIHRQLGTKEMEDQISGVNFLKSLPYVDVNRLGVHGWSFGGFMTTSLMSRYPGVFKVGAAGGPVIDWSYYEIMYGERYMDTPQENKEGYDKNNLLNYVDKLKGKLLMIHGAQDPVVVWQHSILYQKKAVDKGVQLDYYVYPGHEHNVLGKDRVHLMDKICNYFIDNL
jgi:dipeptidyl-peptidase-4